MRASAGTGPMTLWSQRNVLTGFDQALRSKAQGWAFTTEGEIGGTLSTGITIAGYAHYGQSYGVLVTSGGTTVRLQNFTLEQFGTGAALTFFPRPSGGFYVHTRLGMFGLVARALPLNDTSSLGSADMRGPDVSVTVGQEWRVLGHSWLGASGQLQMARLWDGENSGTTFLLPTFRVGATWF